MMPRSMMPVMRPVFAANAFPVPSFALFGFFFRFCFLAGFFFFFDAAFFAFFGAFGFFAFAAFFFGFFAFGFGLEDEVGGRRRGRQAERVRGSGRGEQQ